MSNRLTQVDAVGEADVEVGRDIDPRGRSYADESVNSKNFPNLYELVTKEQAKKNSQPAEMLKNTAKSVVSGVTNALSGAMGAMQFA